jgi:hypothetical protein
MRQVRSFGFEGLETRMLLSKAHLAMAHAVHAAATVPLVINGTLTVDHQAAATSTDSEGDLTTSMPVAGELGTLGEVRGVWNESEDAYGDYLGPDTIQLHDSHGTFDVAFNNATPGKAHPTAQKAVFYQHPQQVFAGTGDYARASERGTIELNTNNARTGIASVTLTTRST